MIVVGALVGEASNGVDPVDGGVAVIRDGELAFALAEERVARTKYQGGFRGSLRAALGHLQLGYGDVDAYAFVSYGDSRIHTTEHIVRQAPELAAVADRLSLPVSHHEAHAFAAARQAPWDESLVVIVDNEGLILGPQLDETVTRNPMERVSYYLASSSSLDLLSRDLYGADDVSLGEAYRRFSYYCGFPSHQLAGKTMALAAYGDRGRFAALDVFETDGLSLQVDLGGAYDAPASSVVAFFERNGVRVAPPRGVDEAIHRDHLDAAAFVQQQLEHVLTERLRYLLAATGQRAICLAGGVAYNCKLVAALEGALGVPVFVPPSPGDQGIGIGAAIGYLERVGASPGRYKPESRLGGARRSTWADIERTAAAADAKVDDREANDLVEVVVDALERGDIVGIVDGRSEVGRRALGARSFIALPLEGPCERLRSLKNREWFRPFGASVLDATARTIFRQGMPDPYMLRAHAASGLPELDVLAHVDGTLRAQLVADDEETLLAAVLRALVARGRPGLVVNTSMNLDGAPLVETEAEALALFEAHAEVGVLVLDESGLALSR